MAEPAKVWTFDDRGAESTYQIVISALSAALLLALAALWRRRGRTEFLLPPGVTRLPGPIHVSGRRVTVRGHADSVLECAP